MSTAFILSAASKNLALNAALDVLNGGGTIKLYTGAKPASPDVAVSNQTLLATLTLASTAFGAASAGSKTAGAITSDTNAAATGTAAWFRACKADGTAVADGTVGTSAADMIIDSTTITQHGTVACSSLVISI